MFSVNNTSDVTFIAEVKTQSPFGFKSPYSWEFLFDLANEHGDIISIHVDEAWGGSLDLLRKAATLTDKPILAKGLCYTPRHVHECLNAGADMVLVMSPQVEAVFQPAICFYEPCADLGMLAGDDWSNVDRVVVVNSRNPHDGTDNPDMWDYFRRLHKGQLVQASKIRTIDDVRKDADGVIVGEHLKQFCTTLHKV